MAEIRVIPQRTFHRGRISLVAEESKEGIKKGGGSFDNYSCHLGENGKTPEGIAQRVEIRNSCSTGFALR
jgi:hypothetical protein